MFFIVFPIFPMLSSSLDMLTSLAVQYTLPAMLLKQDISYAVILQSCSCVTHISTTAAQCRRECLSAVYFQYTPCCLSPEEVLSVPNAALNDSILITVQKKKDSVAQLLRGYIICFKNN